MTSQSCEICGTMTGVHGFSFDARAKELEYQKKEEEMLNWQDWPLCACGKQSLAAIVEHSCENCAEDYAKCPKCLADPDLLALEEMDPIEESLAHILEEDGPWLI